MTVDEIRENEEGLRDLDVQGETHDVDDGTHEVAVDYPHEVLDSYRTDWARGCFDESLAKRLPPMVFNHNADLMIGAGVRHESLGDRTRIVGRFADFDAVPKAREAFALARDKMIPGWSYHYRNGRSVPHPTTRGARRFTKADMLEFGPVTFPSIPGAQTAGLRQDQLPGAAVVGQVATLTQVPDLNVVLKLHDDGHLSDEGLRAVLDEHFPTLRQHITIAAAIPTPQQRIEAVLADQDPELADAFRALVIPASTGASTADDGTITNDGADDPETLIRAIDTTLDAFAVAMSGVDTSQLPADVQQAVSLAQAAGVAVDELQEVMSIDDPDDPLERADQTFSTKPWSNFSASDYTPAQYKSACLIVDGDGSTKDQCKLPVKEPDGTYNANGIEAAAGVLGGARGGLKGVSNDDQVAAAKTLMGLYGQMKKTVPAGILKLTGSGSRSDDTDALIEGTLDRLDRRPRRSSAA